MSVIFFWSDDCLTTTACWRWPDNYGLIPTTWRRRPGKEGLRTMARRHLPDDDCLATTAWRQRPDNKDLTTAAWGQQPDDNDEYQPKNILPRSCTYEHPHYTALVLGRWWGHSANGVTPWPENDPWPSLAHSWCYVWSRRPASNADCCKKTSDFKQCLIS